MGSLDIWVHVGEVVVGIILVPSIRLLVSELFQLRQTVSLMNQSLADHKTDFKNHQQEDRDNFESQETRINNLHGDVREIKGSLGHLMWGNSPRPRD